jgi:HEAT repeat protein
MMFKSVHTMVGGSFVLALLSLGCSQNEATKPAPKGDDPDRTAQVGDAAASENSEQAFPFVAVSKDLERAVLDVFERFELKVPSSKRNPFGLERNIELLKHDDPKERATAAYRLALLNDPRTLEPAIAALDDTDPQVRQWAALTVAKMGDRRGLEPAIAALKDQNPEVRRMAAGALGKLGDPSAVAPLIDALKHRDFVTRDMAANALGQLGDERAIEPLWAALKTKEGRVRSSAAAALAGLGDAQAVVPLLQVLKDPNYNPPHGPVLEGVLMQIGPPAVEPLIAALKDENRKVRYTAAFVLGWLGDPRAVEPLKAALDDEDQIVRDAATAAIAKLSHAPPSTPNKQTPAEPQPRAARRRPQRLSFSALAAVEHGGRFHDHGMGSGGGAIDVVNGAQKSIKKASRYSVIAC